MSTRLGRDHASGGATRRAGFTLIELVVVLFILAGSAAVVTPAFLQTPDAGATMASAAEVTRVLHAARRTSVERARAVTATFEPESGRYWVEATGDAWTAVVAAGVLELGEDVRIIAPGPRVQFSFDSRGMSGGGALVVAGVDERVRVELDPATGGARVFVLP